MKIRILSVLVVLWLASYLPARNWKSIDGNEVEADFVSATETHVTIKRKSDGRRFTLELEKLSAGDREWVASQSEESGAGEPNLPEAVAVLVKEKGTLLFEDDFNREDTEDTEQLGENWTTNSASRAQGAKQNDLVDGELVMTISPKADHAISTVHNTAEPYGDAAVYLRMKLDEGGQLKLAYNDRMDKSVWAGHINGVTINLDKIVLSDEKTGRFNLKYRDGKDTPEGKAILAEILKNADKSFPLDLEKGEWHEVVTLHQADTLTVWIDGEEVGKHTSPGFAHPTRRQFVFAVPRKAIVDDLKVWKLASGSEQSSFGEYNFFTIIALLLPSRTGRVSWRGRRKP